MKDAVADERIFRMAGVIFQFAIAPAAVAIADIEMPVVGVYGAGIKLIAPDEIPAGARDSNGGKKHREERERARKIVFSIPGHGKVNFTSSRRLFKVHIRLEESASQGWGGLSSGVGWHVSRHLIRRCARLSAPSLEGARSPRFEGRGESMRNGIAGENKPRLDISVLLLQGVMH